MTTINNPKNSNPPYFNGAQYNPTTNNSTSSSTQTTVQSLLPYFLSYPAAQGREFMSDVVINGDLIIEKTNNQFVSNINMSISGNIILDSSNNYIIFGDGTQQNTANNDIHAIQNNQNNTFLSPYIQTFQGSNTTGPTTAPLQFSNITSSEYGSLYVDPSPNNDLTLYSNQSTNAGLTIRNPSYSFTINPTIGNVASFINPILSTYSITGNNFVVAPTNNDSYSIYSNSSGGYGLVIANTSGNNGKITLSNNSTTLTTITSATNGLNISDPVTATSFNMSFSSFFESSVNTGISNNSINSSAPIIYFALNDASGNQIIPLYINYNSVVSNVLLNMNNNDIYNCNSVNSSGVLNLTGSIVEANGYEIMTTANSASYVSTILSPVSTNISSANPINCTTQTVGTTSYFFPSTMYFTPNVGISSGGTIVFKFNSNPFPNGIVYTGFNNGISIYNLNNKNTTSYAASYVYPNLTITVGTYNLYNGTPYSFNINS